MQEEFGEFHPNILNYYLLFLKSSARGQLAEIFKAYHTLCLFVSVLSYF
jgi:hypothetical protein